MIIRGVEMSNSIKTLDERILHDFYSGKTLMQIINELRNSYEYTKEQAIDKVYFVLKNQGLKY